MIFLNVCAMDIGFETELMEIITAVIFGCIGGTLPPVCFSMFRQKR